MRWVVLATDNLKNEFLSQGVKKEVDIEWIKERPDFLQHRKADAFFDLEFENKTGEIALLKELLPAPVFINNAVLDDKETSAFISFLAWPTFLQREIAELSAGENHRPEAEKIMELLNRKTAWCNNAKSFISARVVAMIINEAYMALEEGIASKQDIDIAMQLGTHYPHGPFAWAQKIGYKRIAGLLENLSCTDERYRPCRLLQAEITKS